MQENHKRFADKYFETLNAKESAIYAGFSIDTAKQQGWQILQREDVHGRLEALRAEASEKSAISREWVVERFKNISDRCVQAEPVMIPDGSGGWMESGEYKFDSSGANKATEMLGKIIGVFEKDNSQKVPETQIPVVNVYNTAPPLNSSESEIEGK